MKRGCFVTSKFYSILFPVVKASTDVMKDHDILSAPFSVSELIHKHGERCIWYLYLAINGTISTYQAKNMLA